VFGVIAVLVGVRSLRLLFGANAEAGFVKLIYGVLLLTRPAAVFNS
jgi:hypothetical protein